MEKTWLFKECMGFCVHKSGQRGTACFRLQGENLDGVVGDLELTRNDTGVHRIKHVKKLVSAVKKRLDSGRAGSVPSRKAAGCSSRTLLACSERGAGGSVLRTYSLGRGKNIYVYIDVISCACKCIPPMVFKSLVRKILDQESFIESSYR